MTQEIVLTIGLPGSGKTTWADEWIEKNPDYMNINRDDLRLMLQGRKRYAKFTKARETIVTETARSMAVFAINNGKSVIVSDTNLSTKRNKEWKQIADDLKVDYREELFTDVPLGELLRRDARRESGRETGRSRCLRPSSCSRA